MNGGRCYCGGPRPCQRFDDLVDAERRATADYNATGSEASLTRLAEAQKAVRNHGAIATARRFDRRRRSR